MENIEEDIYNKLLQILKKNKITLLYDHDFPLEEQGKYIRYKEQKFIVLKSSTTNKLKEIFTILHESSHAIHDDDLHIFTHLQEQHKEFLTNCDVIANGINFCALENGVPTKDIPALMQFIGITKCQYYPIYEKIVASYYDREGNPLPSWDF